jgi:hypothetical protein
MLKELVDVRQIPSEISRRWYRDDNLDLIIWYDREGIYGFQLCYNKMLDEHSFTWKRGLGYSHNRIDYGETRPGRNAVPLLVTDGFFEKDPVLSELIRSSTEIEPSIVDLVVEHIKEFSIGQGDQGQQIKVKLSQNQEMSAKEARASKINTIGKLGANVFANLESGQKPLQTKSIPINITMIRSGILCPYCGSDNVEFIQHPGLELVKFCNNCIQSWIYG